MLKIAVLLTDCNSISEKYLLFQNTFVHHTDSFWFAVPAPTPHPHPHPSGISVLKIEWNIKIMSLTMSLIFI